QRIAAAVARRTLVDVEAAGGAGAREPRRARATGERARRVGARGAWIAAAVVHGALVDIRAGLAVAGVPRRASAAHEAAREVGACVRGPTAPVADGALVDVGAGGVSGPRVAIRTWPTASVPGRVGARDEGRAAAIVRGAFVDVRAPDLAGAIVSVRTRTAGP